MDQGLRMAFWSACFLFSTQNASQGKVEYGDLQLAKYIEHMFCVGSVANVSGPNIPKLPVMPPPFPDPKCCEESCSQDINRCILTDNCCLGAFSELPSINVSISRMEAKCVKPQLKSPKGGILDAIYSTKIIDTCPQNTDINGTTEEVISRCYNRTKLSGVLPVTDLSTLYTYENKYCALCNSIPEKRLIFWTASVICDKGGIQLENRETVIKDVRESDNCNIVYKAPVNYETAIPKCKPLDNVFVTCNVTGHWKKYDSFIERACLAYTKIYKYKYRNVFCYMCNTDDIEAPSYCPEFAHKEVPFFKQISFSALISPQADQVNPSVTKGGVRQRRLDQIYDPITNNMLKVACQFPKTFSDGACVNLVDTVGGVIFDVYFELIHQEPRETNATIESSSHDFENISRDLSQRVISNITDMGFKEFHITAKTLAIGTKANSSSTASYVKSSSGNPAKVVLFLELTFARKYPVTIVDRILAMENTSIDIFTAHSIPMTFMIRLSHWYHGRSSIIDTRSGDALQTLEIRRSDLQSLPGEFNFKHIPTAYHLTKFSVCPYLTIYSVTIIRNFTKQGVLVLPHNFKLSYGDFLVPSLNFALSVSEFQNETVDMCTETFEHYLRISYKIASKDRGVVFDEKENGIFIISFICTVLSMVSAMCTFVVYCLFKELRTQPGINNMLLALYLFIAQMLFQFGYGSSEYVSDVICKVIGVCLHFFWLTFAMWMNVCCIHTFRVFRSTKIRRDDNKWRVTAFYTLYSWLIASLPVIIHIVVKASGGTDIGYGGKVCYISSRKSVVHLVTVPIVTMVIVNMILYGVVVFKIKRALGHFEHQGESRNLIAVYLKLSTITGGTWILAIVYVLTNAAWAEYLFVIFNASQGVFIAIAFIVNRRVLKLMTSLCRSTLGSRLSSRKPGEDGDRPGPSRNQGTSDKDVGMSNSTFVHTQHQVSGERSTSTNI